MSGALKAYSVLETCENTGGIVFAKHHVVARREGAAEFGGGDFHSVTCRREPGLDRYAESRVVPAADLIEMGWHFECWCGARCDLDSLAERGLPVDGVIGSDRGTVYCSAVCEQKHATERVERIAFEAELLERLSAWIKARLPDAYLLMDPGPWCPHFYTSKEDDVWMLRQAILAFDYPHRQHWPAQFRFEREGFDLGRRHGCISAVLTYSGGDREAFEAFARDQRTKRVRP